MDPHCDWRSIDYHEVLMSNINNDNHNVVQLPVVVLAASLRVAGCERSCSSLLHCTLGVKGLLPEDILLHPHLRGLAQLHQLNRIVKDHTKQPGATLLGIVKDEKGVWTLPQDVALS
jgi:hypothetical protein